MAPWEPLPAQRAVAVDYVTAALSYDYRQAPQAWVRRVRPETTSEWWAAISSSADGGTGGWTTVMASHSVAVATITGIYPARSSGPALRLDVTAVVSISGRRPSHSASAMLVDLVPGLGGTWLVAWAG